MNAVVSRLVCVIYIVAMMTLLCDAGRLWGEEPDCSAVAEQLREAGIRVVVISRSTSQGDAPGASGDVDDLHAEDGDRVDSSSEQPPAENTKHVMTGIGELYISFGLRIDPEIITKIVAMGGLSRCEFVERVVITTGLVEDGEMQGEQWSAKVSSIKALIGTLPEVRSLHIYGKVMSDDFYASFSRVRGVKDISLGFTGPKDQDFVLKSFQCNELEEARISGNFGSEAILQLCSGHKVRRLSLESPRIDRQLSIGLKGRKLEVLKLGNSPQFDDEALRTVIAGSEVSVIECDSKLISPAVCDAIVASGKVKGLVLKMEKGGRTIDEIKSKLPNVSVRRTRDGKKR